MLTLQQVQQVYRVAQQTLAQYPRIVNHLYATHSIVHKEIFSGKVPLLWRDAHVGGCDRHMAVFDDLDIIPAFCFNCYKVTIKPETVVDLIKLQLVFDELKLEHNNTRKCTVETRPRIEGSYVGLIYCEGKADAVKVLQQVQEQVHDQISPNLAVSLKRGCSEFPQRYPQFAEIEIEAKVMQPKADWRKQEQQYDELHSYKPSLLTHQDCKEYSNYQFNRAHALKTWLQYAASIEDESYTQITDESVVPIPAMQERSKNRPTHINDETATDTDIKAQFAQAYLEQKKGSLSRAKKHYKNILKQDPGHADSNHLLGIIATEEGDFNYAEKLLAKCLRQYPDSAEINCNLGNLYYATEAFDKAATCYQKALNNDANHIKAHMNLASTFKQQKKFQQALAHFQQVMVLQPENINACIKLGDMCLEMDRLNDALTCFNRALEIDKNSAHTHTSVGTLFSKAGEAAKAKQHYYRAIELNPLAVEAYFQLGELMRETNQPDDAIACFQTVLQLQGDHYLAHYRMADMMLKKDQTELAQLQLQKAHNIKLCEEASGFRSAG